MLSAKACAVLAAIAMIAATSVNGVAGAEKEKKEILCPRCGVKVVRQHTHRRFGKGFIHYLTRRHTHVKYICPSCGEEWSGPPGKEAKDAWVCPRCGRTLKTCPACAGKASQ